MMKEFINNLIKKYFDYDIVGEYFDTNGNGVYHKKYTKKYYLKCLRKKGGRK